MKYYEKPEVEKVEFTAADVVLNDTDAPPTSQGTPEL